MNTLTFNVRRFASAPLDPNEGLCMMADTFGKMVMDRIGRERFNAVIDAVTFDDMQFRDQVDLLLDEAFPPGLYTVHHGMMLAKVALMLDDDEHVRIRMKYL